MQDYLHIRMTKAEVNAISALGLAHMGDCVYELLVRGSLCLSGLSTAENLHRETVKQVAAPAQAIAMETLLPKLTEEELAYYKRGRNTRVHGVPKNATPGQYARATGLECLFGALYLLGEYDRINELFNLLKEVPDAL